MSATNATKLDTTTTLKVAALKTVVVCAQQKVLLRSVRDTSTFVFCCWITIQQLLLANVRYSVGIKYSFGMN